MQVIEEFGGDDGEGAQNSLPQSRECKVEQKKFYFDVGRNDRGVFLRLTEVIQTFQKRVLLLSFPCIFLPRIVVDRLFTNFVNIFRRRTTLDRI